ncbi:transcriptional regulator [Parasulfuritortus cantonensis]|uniref:Transcriptional regulator n=1 Tax=Parasulfuritortus cantonensis TaxID=2528202 RepID=A0A4R1BG34_9PROT|nr:transcriptional regulator [Parasulfuritortus cantonensis]
MPAALQAFPSLPDDALVGIRVVGGLIDKGPTSVWRDVKNGRLPAPVKMGGATRWRVGDLRQVLAAAK